MQEWEMPRVVFFELNADDPKRAIDFYEKVFGWLIKPMVGPKEYWLVTTGGAREPGIDGGLMWAPRCASDHRKHAECTVGGRVLPPDHGLRRQGDYPEDVRSRDRLPGLLYGYRRQHVRHHEAGPHRPMRLLVKLCL